MQQTATAQGQGNVLVQIVGDANAVTIAGATELRLVSYADFAEAPADPARAGKAGYTATGRRETRILYPYNRASLPLQGREELLARLRAWLVAGGAVSVQALVGGGGSGKTRLAVEVAAWARAQDPAWTAGFARQADLDAFRAAGCRTAWTEPCLVVVDYAAAKGAELGNWLDALAHEKPSKPLRVLLLERTGGESVAWWRALFGRPGADGEAVADLLAAEAPLAVTALATPEERHAVFAAAFVQASGQNPPARSDALDRALLDASLGGEPLFLGMFGLTAAREGLAATRALNADAIALRLAEEELVRIGRVWQAHGLLVGLWGWIRGKAPEGDAATVSAVEGDPGKGSATTKVTGLLLDILEDKPELQRELAALLAGAGGAAAVVQTATAVGDGNVQPLIAGDRNEVTVQR